MGSKPLSGPVAAMRPGFHFEGMRKMSVRGVVKFFNTDKGYGFVKRDDGQGDVFIHVTDVKASGLEDGLGDGDRVEFDLGEGRNGKGHKATNIKLLPMSA
jgi:CspA family cold shock protein